MMPVMAHAMLESIELLAAGARVLKDMTVDGIVANKERAAFLLDQNAIVATSLVPHIGYDTVAVLIKKAFAEGSYETVNSRIAPGGGEEMAEAAIRLLKELG